MESVSSLKVLLWGFGNMNKITLRYLKERGYKIVGVVGHHNIGESPFAVAGLPVPVEDSNLKIVHSNSAKTFLEELCKSQKPDCALVATRSTIKDLSESLLLLGSHGINAVTIAEEAFYSVNTSKELTAKINETFKANKVSVTGTGYQDIFWGFLPVTLLGATHKAEKVKGFTQYNVDDYGIALCEAHGVGLTVEEFEKTIAKSEEATYVWNSNEWIANCLGWGVKKITQVITPILAKKDLFSKSFTKNVEKGKVIGMKANVKTECLNGIEIETDMIGVVYDEQDIDSCRWVIQGEPTTEVVINRPATVELTCASAVNRIPQVVKAKEGYVPSFELGLIKY